MTESKATQSPLMEAARSRHAGGVLYHAERGADLTEKDALGFTALDHMLSSSQLEPALRLLDLGADTGGVDLKLGQSEFTPLHWAAWLGRADWAQRLIDRGARVDAASASGLTPLNCALRHEQIECAETLKDAGADLKSKEGAGPGTGSYLEQSSKMALIKSIFWCLKNKADGGEPERAAQKAIERLSDLDVSVEGQRDALAGAVAYLEAVQITAATPALAKKGRKSPRPGL